MLFSSIEEGADWNNNAGERGMRSSVAIRKITYGNQSDEGTRTNCVDVNRVTWGLRSKTSSIMPCNV